MRVMAAFDGVDHDRLALGQRQRGRRPADRAQAAEDFFAAQLLVGILGKRGDAFAQGQAVAGAQQASGVTAEPGRQVGAAAAQHRHGGDASGHRQIGAAAERCPPRLQDAALFRQYRPVQRQRLAGERGAELRAADGHQRSAGEFYFGPEHGDLDRRLALAVADQRVGELERDRIHRPAGNHAQMLQAVASAVLYRAEQARPVDAQTHRKLSNSLLEMATKRTRSPGANRLAGSRAASKTVSGVRPMMLQPPGVS